MATIKAQKTAKQSSFASEKAYLQQLRAACSRSLLWAKLCGSVQAIALITQLSAMAWLVATFLALVLAQNAHPAGLAEWVASAPGTLSIPAVFTIAAVAVVVRVLSQFGYQHFALKCSEQAQQQARRKVLQQWHLQLQQGHWQEGKNAQHANDIVEPVNQLGGYFSRYLPQQWLALWQPALILALVFSLNWIAGLFLLISAPLIPLFMALIGMGAERIHQRHAVLVQRLAGLFIDRVRNLTLLSLFDKLPQAQSQVQRASDEYRQLNMRTLRIAFLSSAVLEFFAAVAIAAIAIYIGFSLLGYYELATSAQLNLFSGLLILLLAPEFFQPLRMLSQFYHDRAAALGAASILAPSIITENATEEPQPFMWPLQVPSFVFHYQQRQQAIHIPTITLAEGEAVLLQGPSGSGKSTVLQLLAGLLPGIAQTQSATIAYLPQTPWLLQASLLENLTALLPAHTLPPEGPANALHEHCLQVCEQVGLGPLLAQLPAGLDTPIGESGAGISGGEGRRLALARWLLAVRLGWRPTMLLLDEPVAGLDDEARAAVVGALVKLQQQGLSMVIATHTRDFQPLVTRTVHMEGTDAVS